MRRVSRTVGCRRDRRLDADERKLPVVRDVVDRRLAPAEAPEAEVVEAALRQRGRGDQDEGSGDEEPAGHGHIVARSRKAPLKRRPTDVWRR
jgi:hypothetical protein